MQTRPNQLDAATQATAPHFEALEQRVLLSGEARLLVLGSSSVEGIEGSNSFRRPLSKKLDAAGLDVNFIGSKNTNRNGTTPPNADFDRDNEGHSGWNADSFLTGNLETWLKGKSSDGDSYTPDIAVLYVGHNDLFNNQSPASTASEVGQIIDLLRADNPNVTIILGQLHNTLWGQAGYKPVKNANVNASIADFNSRLADLASQKSTSQSPVKVANVNAVLDPATQTTDGQHANEQGENNIAEAFFQAIRANFPLPGTGSPSQPAPARVVKGSVLLSRTGGLLTTEFGGTDSFTVKLSKKPASNVTINLASSNTAEAHVDQKSITFTPDNWNQAQTVTVRGNLVGTVIDGNTAYRIVTSRTISSDPAFSGVDVADVDAVNIDNDAALTGTVYFDRNRNRGLDGQERGIANQTVWLDADLDGQIDADEQVTTTDSQGRYSFMLPNAAGQHLVRVITPRGFTNAVAFVDAEGGRTTTQDLGVTQKTRKRRLKIKKGHKR